MYESILISNFRCFGRLELSDLTRVNLISGLNNAGKTSFLEALFIHSGAYHPALTLRIQGFRGIESAKVDFSTVSDAPWNWVFKNANVHTPIIIRGIEAGQERTTVIEALDLRAPTISRQLGSVELEEIRKNLKDWEFAKVLRLKSNTGEQSKAFYLIIEIEEPLKVFPFPPMPPFRTIYQSSRSRSSLEEDSERLGELELKGTKENIVRALRCIEPKLTDLNVIVTGGKPYIHGKLENGKVMPISLMGEGVAKMTSLLLSISYATGGVVLFDEIENGFHYSVLKNIWGVLAEFVKLFRVQLFATTHSRECIIAAHQAFPEEEERMFRYLRFDRKDGECKVVSYTKENLDIATESNLEVR